MEIPDWKQKYDDQIKVNLSLKRDLAALQGHTIMPCPAASQMGEHACANQHDCWEPCGVMGNDERFVTRAQEDAGAKVDAALGILRNPSCQQMFRGARITSASPLPILTDVLNPAPTPEPLMLPIRPPAEFRQGKVKDDGQRRRRTD